MVQMIFIFNLGFKNIDFFLFSNAILFLLGLERRLGGQERLPTYQLKALKLTSFCTKVIYCGHRLWPLIKLYYLYRNIRSRSPLRSTSESRFPRPKPASVVIRVRDVNRYEVELLKCLFKSL